MAGSNMDGDFAVSMDEVDFINNEISLLYVCRLSDFQLVGVDGSFSIVHRSVVDNISRLECVGGGDTSVCRVAISSVCCRDIS